MRVPPALFTRMSTRPSSVTVRSTMRTTCSSSFTSVGTTRHRRPVSRSTALDVRSRSATVRAAMATSAPWAASTAAVAAPMPVPPPVTMATRPSSPNRSMLVLPPDHATAFELAHHGSTGVAEVLEAVAGGLLAVAGDDGGQHLGVGVDRGRVVAIDVLERVGEKAGVGSELGAEAAGATGAVLGGHDLRHDGGDPVPVGGLGVAEVVDQAVQDRDRLGVRRLGQPADGDAAQQAHDLEVVEDR